MIVSYQAEMPSTGDAIRNEEDFDSETAAIPEGGRQLAGASQSWSGILVGTEAWEHTPTPVLHAFQNEDKMLVVTALEERGGLTSPRLSPGRQYHKPQEANAINFVCSGMQWWGYSETLTYVETAMLLFDRGSVESLLGDQLDRQLLQEPLLCHQDPRLFELLRLLADAAKLEGRPSALYADGLLCAVLALLFGRQQTIKRESELGGLATWQIDRVTDYMRAKLPERTQIFELADIVGLSPSHFSRAFKASVGVAPYRWQLQARIQAAQSLLRESQLPLEDIAIRTGFVDGAHFNRIFRNIVGLAPGAWRQALGRRT